MYIVFILQCRECKHFLNHTQKTKTLDILVEFHIECLIYSTVRIPPMSLYMRRRVPGDVIHLVDV